MDNFKPQCVHTRIKNDKPNAPIMGIAYTNNGFLLPCCLIEGAEMHPVFQKFLKPELNVANNESIEDIITSDIWIDFFYNLINRKNVPEICIRKCTYHEEK